MTSALVTGGSGFLGRALVRSLAGIDVTVLDLAPTEGVRFIAGDLGSAPAVFEAVAASKPDIIYHCGAILSAFAEADVRGAVRANAEGTFNVLEAARVLGVPKVVFTSTIATYGPGVEDPVNDDSLQLPETIYGVTKVYCERLGEYYHRRYGLDFRGVRLPSVIGAGRGPSGASAWSSLIIDEPARGRPYAVPVSPETRMPVMYAADAVRALIEIGEARASDLSRRVYLVAGLSPSAGELASEVRRAVPDCEISFAPDPQVQSIVDTWPASVDDSLAASDWGWKTAYSLPELVDEFVEAARVSAR